MIYCIDRNEEEKSIFSIFISFLLTISKLCHIFETHTAHYYTDNNHTTIFTIFSSSFLLRKWYKCIMMMKKKKSLDRNVNTFTVAKDTKRDKIICTLKKTNSGNFITSAYFMRYHRTKRKAKYFHFFFQTFSNRNRNGIVSKKWNFTEFTQIQINRAKVCFVVVVIKWLHSITFVFFGSTFTYIYLMLFWTVF